MGKESSSKPIGTEMTKAKGVNEAIPPSVSEMLNSAEEELPQPGCSRPVQFRIVKAVLPAESDDLIEVGFMDMSL